MATKTKTSIEPLEDRVVIRPLDAEEVTSSGLVIPDTAKEKPQEGEVIAVGPGRWDEDGEKRIPVDVKSGDRVLYSKYAGHRGQDRRRRAARRSCARHPRAASTTPKAHRSAMPSQRASLPRGRAPCPRGRRGQAGQCRPDHPRPQGTQRRPREEVGRADVITNDGVTIAKEVEVEDRFENLGAQLAKEVASKTNDVAGDGTTTATVLAQAMVHEGMRNVAAGANPMVLRRGIEKGVEAADRSAARAVEGASRAAKTIAHVAANSAADARGRRHDRRGDGQGRQGRRHHGRGVPDVRARARDRRGHAVRPRLHLAVLRHGPGPHGSDPRRAADPARQQEDLGGQRSAPGARARRAVGQAAAHRRRGRRGRSARDPRRQQDPRDDQSRSGEGARLR